MDSLFSNPYLVWVLPPILIWLFSRKHAHPLVDVVISSLCILFSVDLLLHPPLINLDPWGFFGGSTWFNPNVSSISLALIINILPARFTLSLGSKEISVHFLFLISSIGILILISESLLGMAIFFTINIYRFLKRGSFSRLNWGILSALGSVAIFLNFGHIWRSLEVRFEIWKITLNIVRENLWFGIGPGNYARYFLTFRTENYSDLKGWGKIQIDPHNLALDLIVTYGVIGAVLITAILIVGMRKLSKIQKFSGDELFLFLTFFGQSIVNVNSIFIACFFLYCATYLRDQTKKQLSDYS